MDATTLQNQLDTFGELHAYLDSGKELHLHTGDVDIDADNDWAEIASAEGHWGFHPSKIEYVKYPESHA